MSLTPITVVYSENGLANPATGGPAVGTVELRPVQETPGPTYTIIAAPVTFVLVSGQINPESNTFYTNGQPALQAIVTERLAQATDPAPYVVSIPTSGTLDLSTTARGPVAALTPLYIPVSAITAKGDLLIGTAPGAITHRSVGTDGFVLTADHTQADGLKWAAAGAGTVTSVGNADDTITVTGDPTVNPTLAVNAISEAQVTGLAASLAAMQPKATLTTKGDLYVATASATVTREPVGADGLVLTAASGQSTGMMWAAAGFKPAFGQEYFTSGDINFPSTSGAFVPVQQASGGNPLLEVDIAASAGHLVLMSIEGIRTTGEAASLDVGFIVGSTVTRFLSSGTATPAQDGLVSLLADPANFLSMGNIPPTSLVSGDIDSGTLRVVLCVNSNGTQTLKCSSANQVVFSVINLGPHT